MTLEIGQTVSCYRIVDTFGEGDRGVAYNAHDAQLNHHLAIKVLPRKVAEAHRSYRRILATWSDGNMANPELEEARNRLANLERN